jgi:hypothetical protein
LRGAALLDPDSTPDERASADLSRLLAAQLALDEPARPAFDALAHRATTVPNSRPAYR